MIESEIFTGFTLRDLPGDRRVAVLHLIGADGLDTAEESVFDEASLAARVRALHAVGSDTSISEAALRALQGLNGASPPGAAERRVGFVAPRLAPRAEPPPAAPDLPKLDEAAEVVTGLPGRGALARALRDALSSCARRLEHGPQLAVLTVRGLDAVAACYGQDAVAATLLGVHDRLDENLRRMDTLVHLGGPRFAACLPRVPRRDAEAIAKRLARAIGAAPIDTPCGPVALQLDTTLIAEAPGAAGTTAERAAAIMAELDASEALVTA